MFLVSPGKIGVGLRKPQFRQPVHYFGASEGLSEKHHLRMSILQLPNHPLPERERLGVRVVHTEHANTVTDPMFKDALKLFPKIAPLLALEVERVDVLVLLGGIFRILDGAVRPALEPIGALRHVRMVRRTLESDVQGDGQTPPVRLFHQTVEVVNRAQLRVNRLVAARGRTYSPRTADIGRFRSQRVVLPLAVRGANRMDWRQVENIEAHPGDAVQMPDDVVEGAVPAFFCSGGTREHLIPGAKRRQLRVNTDAQMAFVGHHRVLVCPLRKEFDEPLVV